jgi:hypothetical protein
LEPGGGLGHLDGLKKKELPRKRQPEIWQKPLEDFNFEKHHQRIQRRVVNYVKILYLILLFLLVSLGTVFGIESTTNYKTELQKNSKDVESEIKIGLDFYNKNDLESASQHFTIADQKLKKLKIQLQEGGQYIPFFFYLPQSDSTLNESTKILKATGSLTGAITLVGHLSSQFDQKNSETDQVKMISAMTSTLSKTATDDLVPLKLAKQNLQESQDILLSSKDSTFKDLRQQLLAKIPSAEETLNGLINIYQQLPAFLGSGDTDKRYLILFQNNSELRPAGGFLGSFAAADFSKGSLKSLDFQTNIYKIDQPFMAATPIPAPPEYQYLSANMALRDSNYSADFSQAAPTVMDFYQKETSQKADGVIALDTSFITDLLKIIGPIEMKDYGLTVTSDNFLSEIEYQVEIGYFKDKTNWPENAPKKILAEMMPKLISKAFSGLNDPTERKQIMALLNSSLSGKHLLFYSNDAGLEKFLADKNYAGKIQPTGSDYFFLSNANIGGLKSSLNVKESVAQTVSIDANGSVSRTVDIKRVHQGTSAWPDGENKTFNKVFVPLGSKLKSFRILQGDNLPYGDWANRDKATTQTSEEDGKTVFSFWLNTKPGETSELTLDYILPPTIIADSNYSLLIQKQPGTLGRDYTIDVKSDRKQVYIDDQKLLAPLSFNLLEDNLLKINLK